MEDKKIRRNLYRVLRKTGVQKQDIKPGADYRQDLHFDSVDWKIFTFYLERIFDISVRDEELLNLGNVNDTFKLIQKSA
ncbi:MAG: acyl carrier protein [Prolixibacteraceae bacterium]|nr:acyl carrier protein [Prolixibacteraceae bacterium]